MSIAVFDVDRTLLRGDALLLAARKSNSLIELIWFSINFIPFLVAWKLRLINTKKVKESFIERFKICQKYNLEISQNNPNWLVNDLKKIIRKKALSRLNMHKEKGDIVILCSASPDMILEGLAKELNVHLICTNMSKVGDKWTANIKGKNCQGHEKLKRLKERYGSLKNLKLEVYGDSKGDQQILNAASIPHFRNFVDCPSEYPIYSLNSIIPIIGIAIFTYLAISNLEIFFNYEKQPNNIWINILIGEFLVIISYVIRFFRWNLMLESIKLKPPILKNIYIWMGSFAFTATPGKAGEGIRVLLLNKQCKIPIMPVLSALFIERLTDGMAVLLIFFLNFKLIPINNSKNNLNLFLFSIIIVGLVLILLNNRKIIQNLLKFIVKNILPNKKIQFDNKNLDLIKVLISPINITISTMLGLVAWIIEGTSFFIILKGFNTSISWLAATFTHTTSSLLGALTFMPGGLGPTEASTIGLLSMQGIPVSIATSATFLIRLMTLWFATILGVICLLLNNYKAHKKSFNQTQISGKS